MLKRVLGLGDIQAYFLAKCVKGAFEERGFRDGDRGSWNRRPPSLPEVSAYCSFLLSSQKKPDASLFSLKRRLDMISLSGVFSSKTQVPFSVVTGQTCCFELKGLRSADAQAVFAEVFLRKLYSYCQSLENLPVLFALVDEAQKLCVGTEEEPSYVATVLREARKFRLGLIVVSQSVKALDPALAANCAVNAVFLTREPDDAAYAVALLCGGKYSDKARLVEEELHSLQQFEALFSTSVKREVTKVRVKPLWEDGVKENAEAEAPFISGSFNQRLFYEELRRLLPAEKIVFSDRTVLPPFEIDVTFPERKLAVEWDGAFFHAKDKQKARDGEKETLLAKKGWRLIRVVDAGLSAAMVREKALEVADGLPYS